MSILHIVPALFGDGGVVGGAERYAFELARHMAEERPTTLLSFGDTSEERRVGNLRLRLIGSPRYLRNQRGNPISGDVVGEILKAKVVHCHQQHVFASSLAAIVCRLTGRRAFVSDLGGGGWDLSSYVSTDRLYHGHLHISQYSESISGHVGKGWSRIIYGGVDCEKFSPGPVKMTRKTVVFVGRILPHKGIDDLIRAMPSDITLEIIGRRYDERYFSDLERTAIGKSVVFRPDCDDDEIICAYRRALCVVLPSVYRDQYGNHTRVPELLGQTLLEGMACGAPAICTKVASMPELVRDGESGFIVPPNDPDSLRERILWLQAHPCEAAAMGKSGRARVMKDFTWHTVVQRCMQAYDSASGGSKG